MKLKMNFFLNSLYILYCGSNYKLDNFILVPMKGLVPLNHVLNTPGLPTYIMKLPTLSKR